MLSMTHSAAMAAEILQGQGNFRGIVYRPCMSHNQYCNEGYSYRLYTDIHKCILLIGLTQSVRGLET